jgi:transcriptional activator SPT8
MWERRRGRCRCVRAVIRAVEACFADNPAQASWSCDGHSVFVGRRNAAIDVYDIRAGSTSSLALPTASGPISAVTPLYGGRHLAVASHDTLRIWDLHTETSAKRPPFRVVSPSYGTTISQMGAPAR